MSKKIIIDDGFNPEFVERAFFDGILEIPCLKKPEKIIIPKSVIPFSKRKQSRDHEEYLVFYEYDIKFADILRNPKIFLPEVKQFAGIITLDCSVYFDSPLLVQIANVYRSRVIGYYFQNKGVNVIPNVRWGDERSYTTKVLPEKFAFLGLPKKSIYSIGTYGVCQTKEEKYHLRQGLIAMIDELEPEVILVYGAMPDSIFKDLKDRTLFIQYPDWISSMKRRIV